MIFLKATLICTGILINKSMKKEEKVFCNSCKTTTNHSILSEHKVSDEVTFEENGTTENLEIGQFLYQVINCNGCGAITFRYRNYRTEFYTFDEITKEEIFVAGKYYDTYFPERINDQLLTKQFPGIPSIIFEVYNEIINAYNRNSFILCASGLRTITEAVCNHFKMDGVSLGNKIYNLSKCRLINKELSEALRAHKFLGNDAVHNLISPTKEELRLSIELFEDVLHSLFTIPFKHNDLKNRISKRM